MKNIANKRKNAGFTLLELVVVVAVMGLISTMAMDVYTDNSNQKRFEATKQRLAEIKFAMIGDASRDLITGYVVDEGKLPENINALMYEEYCTNINYFDPTSCANNSGVWKDDATNWNGPYLRNRQTNNDGNFVFNDGWGNAFEFSTGSNGVVVISIGLDKLENSASEYNTQSPYEQDYPRSDSTDPEADPKPLITVVEFENTLKQSSIVYAWTEIKALSAGIDKNMCIAIRKDSSSDVFVSNATNVDIVHNETKKVEFGRLKNTDTTATDKYLDKTVMNINSVGNNEYILVDSPCTTFDWSSPIVVQLEKKIDTDFDLAEL